MPTGFQIGRLFQTNIYAAPSYFIALALYFLLWQSPAGAAVWGIALTLSLLVHEFGHALAARKLAGAECYVVLWLLGGLCVHTPVAHRGKRFAIALMGPAFGFVFGGIAWLVSRHVVIEHDLLRLLVVLLVWVNLFWTAVNLLPIWPLDGGQALLVALSARMGARAVPLVRRVSVVTAAAGCFLALRFGFHIAAFLAIMLASENLLGRGPVHD